MVVAEALVEPVELEHRVLPVVVIHCPAPYRSRALAARPPRAVSSAHERGPDRAQPPDGRRTGRAARGRRRVPRLRAVGAGDPDGVRRTARRRRGSSWSASSPATRRTGRASRSSARPGSCWTGRWPTPGSTAGTPTSPTRSSTSGSSLKGKRRIHQTPGPEHLRACLPWLAAEFAVLKPEVVVCLGATAAKALISPSFRDHPGPRPSAALDAARAARRGRRRAPEADDDEPDEGAPAQTWMLATTHPSAVLRAPDEGRAAAYDALVADLAVVARALACKRPRCMGAPRACERWGAVGSVLRPPSSERRGTARTRARPARRRPSPR